MNAGEIFYCIVIGLLASIPTAVLFYGAARRTRR